MNGKAEEQKSPDDKPRRGAGSAPAAMPPAGPHAKPELTNPDATPGAGSLPDPDAKDVDGGAG